MHPFFRWSLLVAALAQLHSHAADRADAAAALRKAVAFFQNEVSTHGGYLWRYSADLSLREGEGVVTNATVWVQPPGTPAVGMAYLNAYQRTGETYLLDAAEATAGALLRGQLRSGGWTDRIHFDPADRKRFAYRLTPSGDPVRRARNVSTLDDNKTQSALLFLIRLDRALNFQDHAIHEAALFGLDSMVQAQFANGAWPQGWDHSIDSAGYPPIPAAYPDSWPREYSGHQNYWFRPTFNDGAIADAIDLMFEAAEIYGEDRYRASALRAGNFILLAQMPEPQPAWAQQYNERMEPIWARRFEPPAISGGESQGILRTLLSLYERTGDRKWLEPIPRAIAWFKRSTLPDGRVARFYELRTNKPLYFTMDYTLTYDDSDLPTHYSFKVGSDIESIERLYHALSTTAPDDLRQLSNNRLPRPHRRPGPTSHTEVQRVIDAMDSRGAWTEPGRLRYQPYEGDIISTSTFIQNIELLSRYLQSTASN